jgi:hypothetical protein
MQLTSLKEYDKACRIVPKRVLSTENMIKKAVLDRELNILNKQLSYLEVDLEKMVIMTPDELGPIDFKKQQVGNLRAKIIVKERAIKTLYIAPYAEAVWVEAESILHHLRNEMQEQYAKCYELKEVYLQALAGIGELKKQSELVAGEASKVRFDLIPVCNPMDGIKTAKEITFAITLEEIQRKFRG